MKTANLLIYYLLSCNIMVSLVNPPLTKLKAKLKILTFANEAKE